MTEPTLSFKKFDPVGVALNTYSPNTYPDPESFVIGGDYWAQSHISNLVSSVNAKLRFNDFSLQNGGINSSHAGHRLGLEFDFVPRSYVHKYYLYTRSRKPQRYEILKYSHFNDLKDTFDLQGIEGVGWIDSLYATFYLADSSFQNNGMYSWLSLSEKQIIRSRETSSRDLNFFANRTCLVDRTLRALSFDERRDNLSGYLTTWGHHNHFHITGREAEKVTPRFRDNFNPFTGHTSQFEGDDFVVRFNIANANDRNLYFDVITTINKQEKRLFQLSYNGPANSFIDSTYNETCQEPKFKNSESYIPEFSWCDKFKDLRGFTYGNTLEFRIPKDKYFPISSQLASLDLRVTSVLDFSPEGNCSEEIYPFTNVVGCFDDNNQPVGGRIHPNGGGLVSDGADVDDQSYIGPNVKICPGANISGGKVKLSGSLSVRGNVNLSGCVEIDAWWQSSEIDALDGEIKMTGDCSDYPNRSIQFYPSQLVLKGNVTITAPIDVRNWMYMYGYDKEINSTVNKDHDISFGGSCNRRGLLGQPDPLLYDMDNFGLFGPIKIENCFEGGLLFGKNIDAIFPSDWFAGGRGGLFWSIENAKIRGAARVEGWMSNIDVDVPFNYSYVDVNRYSTTIYGSFKDSNFKASEYLDVALLAGSDLVSSTQINNLNFNCVFCNVKNVGVRDNSSFLGYVRVRTELFSHVPPGWPLESPFGFDDKISSASDISVLVAYYTGGGTQHIYYVPFVDGSDDWIGIPYPYTGW